MARPKKASLNKTAEAIKLMAEWQKAGKDIRSTVDIVNALNELHPGAGFSAANVNQAKNRFKKMSGAHDTTVTETDVMAAVGKIGIPDAVREIKRLIDHGVHPVLIKELVDALA